MKKSSIARPGPDGPRHPNRGSERVLRARSLGLLTSAVVTFGCSAERNESGEIVSRGVVDAFAVQVGDCYDDAPSDADQVTEVSGIPCSEPHDNEVFALFDAALSEFPGDEAMETLADEGCLERFVDYVGTSYEESVLAITHLVPTARSWRLGKDREVVCVAYHMEFEKLEGSVRDSGM